MVKSDVAKLVEVDSRGELTDYFHQIGFKFVSVDLSGFRSGSMNRVLVELHPNRRDLMEADDDGVDIQREAIG